MMWRRLAVILTLLNFVLLIFVLAPGRLVSAQGAAPVLRGRALELVDDHGHVRAEIKVFPAQPNLKMPDGTRGYPETVLLRLIDSKGSPHVKIAATEDGSAIVFGGDSDPTLIQLLARGATTSVKLVNGNGRQQVVKP